MFSDRFRGSDNHMFSDRFRGSRTSLFLSNLRDIRSKIWRRFLSYIDNQIKKIYKQKKSETFSKHLFSFSYHFTLYLFLKLFTLSFLDVSCIFLLLKDMLAITLWICVPSLNILFMRNCFLAHVGQMLFLLQ